jgi:hypothetical protein
MDFPRIYSHFEADTQAQNEESLKQNRFGPSLLSDNHPKKAEVAGPGIRDNLHPQGQALARIRVDKTRWPIDI